jgi:hypothetical protein
MEGKHGSMINDWEGIKGSLTQSVMLSDKGVQEISAVSDRRFMTVILKLASDAHSIKNQAL